MRQSLISMPSKVTDCALCFVNKDLCKSYNVSGCLFQFWSLETLSIKDAKVSLITLGINTKSDEIRTYLNNHRRESEDRETLDQSRFLNFAAQKLIQAEKAHKAFGLIDKDKKGVVVLEDLQRVAQELGGEDAELTQDELQEMIDLVDKSGNGFLSTKDFERIARKVNLWTKPKYQVTDRQLYRLVASLG